MESLDDYDSEADEDFVPDSPEENNSDYDENGNPIKKKRKRPQKKKPESRSRQPLGEKKKKKTVIGAEVISDEEDNFIYQPDVPKLETESNDNNNDTETVKKRSRPSLEMSFDELEASTVVPKTLQDYCLEDTTTKTADALGSESHSGNKVNGDNIDDILAQLNKPKRKSEKKKVTQAWESWLDDSKDSVSQPEPVTPEILDNKTEEEKQIEKKLNEKHHIVVKETASFAGQRIEVTRKIEKGTEAEKRYMKNKKSHIESVVSSFKKPKDLTTMEMSMVDWTADKEAVGDAFELEQNAKAGELKQMEFLLRVDNNVFEIERSERERQRKLQQLQSGGSAD